MRTKRRPSLRSTACEPALSGSVMATTRGSFNSLRAWASTAEVASMA
jgi:hypothetical protein